MRFRPLLLCWFALAALFCFATVQAEPFIEHVEPPAITRGQVNRVTLVGHELHRAEGLWLTLPAQWFEVKVIASSVERTELEVKVAADCPLGMYGLRLATEDGLSNLHLIAIDELAPVGAQPHESIQQFPVAIAGDLQAADVDRLAFEVQAGQQLTFDIFCSRFGTDADPLLTIVDERDKRIAQKDNSPGLFYDCHLTHTFKAAGKYVLEVRDSRFAGAPHWRYWLRIGGFPAARVSLPSTVMPGVTTRLELPEMAGGFAEIMTPSDQAAGAFYQPIRIGSAYSTTWLPLVCSTVPAAIESEPNDTKDSPTHVTTFPASLQGVLNPARDVDCFSFELKKGQKLSFKAESKTLQSAADLELILCDRTWREVQRMDDVQLPGGALEEPAFNFTANDDAIYYLQVRDMSGSGSPAHAYRVEVTPTEPKLVLTSEISALSVPLGSYQRLPLTVIRTDCPGPIELELIGAPKGVKLEPTIIPEGANTLDCKLHAASETALGLSTLSIRAKTTVGEQPIIGELKVQPLVDRQLINVDLIKHALRENQRWLPPSVTRTFALQVVPAVPFTVELVEPQLTLPRYLQATTTITTTREAGFDAPISFTALGGQVGEERQGRRQVFARIPVATKEQTSVPALFISRSLAQDVTERIDVTAVAKQGDRTIRLQRSLSLAVKPGFEVSFDPPPPPTLPPGSKLTIRLAVQRLPEFSGPVTIEPQPVAGLELPEPLTIPPDAASTEFAVQIPADFRQGRHRFRFVATGQVGNFQEEPRPKEFDLEVKAPPPEKNTEKK